MTIHQFLLILRARYKAVLLTLAFTIALAALATLLMPRRYTATAAVLVDVKSPDPVAGLVLPGMVAAGYMDTQIDIINSDRVAQRAVTLLRLDNDPDIRADWVRATGGEGSFIAWLGNRLQRELTVHPARDSNVITIDFNSTNPEFSAQAANAFVKAYIDINLDLKVEPARQYAQWFQAQVQVSRDKLDAAQRALYAYQKKVGIVATDERLDAETAKLNEEITQLTSVQTLTTDSQTKRAASNPATVAEVMQSPLVNSLKTEIARVEARLQESSGNLGSNHPQTLRTEAELASLKAQAATEIAHVTASIGTSFQVGKLRERELQSAIDAQKERVIEINDRRNDVNVLKGDVEVAQREFEGVSQRASQTRLESLSNQTNLSTLSVATASQDPSRPRPLLNMLVAVFIGTLLGIGMALGIELANRRVRSAEDLSEFLEVPVLASISSSRPDRRERRSNRAISRNTPPSLGNRSAA